MNPKHGRFFSNEALMEGLRKQDSEIIGYIYEHVGPMVYDLVMGSGGDLEDARDIFQEGILAAYLNILSGKYQLSYETKFSTYLVQICKYKWYDARKSSHHRMKGAELPEMPLDDQFAILPANEDRIKWVVACFKRLGDRCRKILHLFYWEKWSLDQIAVKMNLGSNSVKNQKYRCMKQLRSHVLEKNMNRETEGF